MNDLDENDVFFNNDNKDDLIKVYQNAATHLDSFITLINDAALHKELSEEELYDIEVMADISGTMLIQLLNLIKSKEGDYDFLDDTSRMNENGLYDD